MRSHNDSIDTSHTPPPLSFYNTFNNPGWQEEGLGTNPKAPTTSIDAWCRSHKIKGAEWHKEVGGFI
jgi:hypothetical protein